MCARARACVCMYVSIGVCVCVCVQAIIEIGLIMDDRAKGIG